MESSRGMGSPQEAEPWDAPRGSVDDARPADDVQQGSRPPPPKVEPPFYEPLPIIATALETRGCEEFSLLHKPLTSYPQERCSGYSYFTLPVAS